MSGRGKLATLAAALIWLALLGGCAEQGPPRSAVPLGPGDDGSRPADNEETEPAYATHVVAYGNSLEELADQSVLDNYDIIILGAQNLPHLEERHLWKAVMYFNCWAKDGYNLDELNRPWEEWQPGPGDIGQAEISLYPGSWAYRFDDAHVELFLGWIEDFLSSYPGKVKGVFLDDFSFSRQFWYDDCADCTQEQVDQVWGPWDGRDGWQQDSGGWNIERISAIETGALELVARYCGPDGVVIANGTAPVLEATRRFAENVGHVHSESWPALIDEDEDGDPVNATRYIRPGDLLQVNALDSDGIWRNNGFVFTGQVGSGWLNTVRACSLAVFRDCSVGIGFGEPPAGGGSRYSLFLDPADVPQLQRPEWFGESTWPYYYGYR